MAAAFIGPALSPVSMRLLADGVASVFWVVVIGDFAGVVDLDGGAVVGEATVVARHRCVFHDAVQVGKGRGMASGKTIPL